MTLYLRMRRCLSGLGGIPKASRVSISLTLSKTLIRMLFGRAIPNSGEFYSMRWRYLDWNRYRDWNGLRSGKYIPHLIIG